MINIRLVLIKILTIYTIKLCKSKFMMMIKVISKYYLCILWEMFNKIKFNLKIII